MKIQNYPFKFRTNQTFKMVRQILGYKKSWNVDRNMENLNITRCRWLVLLKRDEVRQMERNIQELLQAQVYEEGEYINAMRIGIWNIIYQNKPMQLCNQFQCDNQIILKNLLMVTRLVLGISIEKGWLFSLTSMDVKRKGIQNQCRGQEYYDQEGQKYGKWVELSDDFKKFRLRKIYFQRNLNHILQ
ncbi:unnamed protein product [Paramecium primaurelia]|uniref:Uncharacterized protein n=1 Tax=Paramecium primaurelia TaxID=5886 RepID=A0A8S1Q3T5_PARPR|nr:unnamed protein product [Paramecium primaurelia]